jgi:hypothetical protein
MELKWKTFRFATVTTGVESLVDMLAGLSGKNRVIKFIKADINADVYLRLYRDGEQVVDVESNLLTSYYPLLLVNITLKDGQLLKGGFYNKAGTATTPDFAIGYEEAD